MKLEGVVHNGVIVPDDSQVLSEGTRVRIEPVSTAKKSTFGELFGDLMVDCSEYCRLTLRHSMITTA